jgi:hypothetical protein
MTPEHDARLRLAVQSLRYAIKNIDGQMGVLRSNVDEIATLLRCKDAAADICERATPADEGATP